MKNKLPKNWVEVSLKEVTNNRKGKKPNVQAEVEFEGSIPYMDIKALEHKIIRQYADIESSKLFEEGDIAMVWDGARSGWVSKTNMGAIGSTLVAFQPILFNSNYLFYYLLKKYPFLNSNARGVGIPHVDPTILWDLKFPLPPLLEQNRIVEKLDNMFNQLETIKASLSNIPLLLKDFRQQILTQAVTGKLTKEWRKGKELESGEAVVKKLITKKNELITDKKLKAVEAKTSDINDNLGILPMNWAKTELVNVARIIDPNPSHRMPEYFENGIPFISTENIVNNEINFNKGKKVGTSTLNDQIKRFAINQNDFLFTRIGTIGKSCYLPTKRDYAISHAVCVVGSFDAKLIDPNYLKLIISSSKIIEQGLHGVKSVGVPDLGMGKVRAFIIPITSVQEQQEIVSRVESLFAKADAIEQQYKILKAKIDSLPQALLHKAFNGELTEQLDIDGDARELLKEIEALKAASSKVKKGGKVVKVYEVKNEVLGMVAEG